MRFIIRRRPWRSPHWQKAPVALIHHRSALVAVLLAGFLVALASSSAPFVTTATASAALKNKLVDLSPLATGLQIGAGVEPARTAGGLATAVERRDRAAHRLAARLGLESPVVTAESTMPGAVLNGNGDTRLTLMARTDALRHVRILARTGGEGVWIADVTAQSTGLRPGGTLRLEYSGQGGAGTRTVGLRVKGIYRALDRSAPDPYWANFLQEIFPQGVDPPPPQRYVFMSFRALYRTVDALSMVRTFRNQGHTFRFASGPQLTTIAEMAVDRRGLTLARARALNRQFSAVKHALARSALGRDLGCALPRRFASSAAGERLLCSISSSLSAAVVLANENASAISPIVSLLSAAGTAITLAVAGAAGAFLVRRRRAEAALLFARGEHVATFTTRSIIEMFLPMLLGAAIGFGAALGLTGAFAPAGSIDGATVFAAVGDAALASAAALVLAAAAAAAVFIHLFDTGMAGRGRLRRIPWELPLLAVGAWLLHHVLSGGGIAGSGIGTAGHPTRAVFVLPLVFVAAVTGLIARVLRISLNTRRGSARGLPTALFLVLRRLAAARALLTVLLVVSAVSFGAYFYAQALAVSVGHSVDEKAYIAYGGDVQGLVSDSSRIPSRFAYPATTLDFASQAATVGGPNGATAAVLAVDPATIGAVIRWYPDWGADPRGRLNELAAQSAGALPAIVTRSVPPETVAIWLQHVRLPIRIVATVSAFPGMSAGIPLLVVGRDALERVAARAHLLNPLGVTQSYVWAKGPPAPVARSVEAPPLEAGFVTTVDDFRKDPDVLLATRTFTYMRLIAAAAGVLVFVGLLLYLQARQRAQAVASALAARMGLRRATETLSLSLELAAVSLVAAVIGGVVALLSALPIVRHIDPLADYAPAPTLVIPVDALVTGVLGVLLVAFIAGAATSWLSRRSDPSEAIRIA